MGKRSRKQSRDGAAGGADGGPSLRQRADRASRIAEERIKQRPAAWWDPFPLTELAIFVGLVLLVVGALTGGSAGRGLIASGLLLAALGGLETALREHLAGYRSHAGLLGGLAALAALIISSALVRLPAAAAAAIAVGTFALVFPVLRNAFIRRSGGRGVL